MTASRVEHTAEQTRFWEKLELMAEIAAVIAGPSSEAEAYCRVLELVQAMVPYDAATAYLQMEDSNTLEAVAELHGKVPLAIDMANAESRGSGREALKPVVLDMEAIPSPDAATDVFEEYMLVPLRTADSEIGWLMLAAGHRGSFQSKHLRLMSVIASQLAVATALRRSREHLREQHADLRRAHDELRRLHRHLVRKERLGAVKRLAAAINHEINNPLTVIVGNVQFLLLTNKDAPDNQLARLRRIESAALRIGEINRKLLHLDTLAEEAARGAASLSAGPTGEES